MHQRFWYSEMSASMNHWKNYTFMVGSRMNGVCPIILKTTCARSLTKFGIACSQTVNPRYSSFILSNPFPYDCRPAFG